MFSYVNVLIRKNCEFDKNRLIFGVYANRAITHTFLKKLSRTLIERDLKF